MKYLLRFACCLLAIALLSCSNDNNSNTITIGASPEPHATILEQVRKNLAKDGYNLKILVFNDYVTPNIALNSGQIDANYTQGEPFLELYNQDHHTNLVKLVAMHVEPMGAYLSKTNQHWKSYKNLATIPVNFKVGIPNEPTSEARALKILAQNGFISINQNKSLISVNDIINNPHQIKIIPLDPAILPRELSANELDMALINSNYAISAGYIPGKNSIFLEKKDSPYVNIIAVRNNELSDPKIKALAKAATDANIRNFINQKYKGSIICAF